MLKELGTTFWYCHNIQPEMSKDYGLFGKCVKNWDCFKVK
jgi:hypothetical protein